MTETLDQTPIHPVKRAELDLTARLAELSEGDGLKMPIKPGPAFVLLAIPIGEPDYDLVPEDGACEKAARELISARPGGYDLIERTSESIPPNTFGSFDPNPNDSINRFAYVHVSDDGMMEMVSGAVAESNSGALVGLGLVEKWIRERDAKAMQTAFEVLEAGGPIMVTVALLRTHDVEVKSMDAVPAVDGVMPVPYVTIQPRCFNDRSALHADNLAPLVDALWKKIIQQASSAESHGA
ncbi:hypothetical protein [Burkholderia ubonensis]|uniref:hypothetical protein n=1 Tax=Burkholderia ubonensis TaxID=101571 RepID=UPI0012FBACE8|nr:hypothetical protein [Burkholderia ubonensis]